MDDWQIQKIQSNIVQLITGTNCSTTFISTFTASSILAKPDEEILEVGGLTPSEKAKRLYQIILTRVGAYDVLLESLKVTKQTGMLHILTQNNSQDRNCGKISYDRNHLLGKGGHGTKVYKGKFGGRVAAVKVLNPDLVDPEQARREIELLEKLDSHDNIVRYFNAEFGEELIFIALELCHCNLEHEITMKILNADKFKIIGQCTSGIAHLHAKHVIHRDLKPANILLTVNHTVKISDFGLSKQIPIGASRVSVTGIIGTADWMAPEILKQQSATSNTLSMTTHSDIFSLGCIFYYVLSGGSHPFGDELERPLYIAKDKRQIDKTLISENWSELIMAMIAHVPQDRPSADQISSTGLRRLLNAVVRDNPKSVLPRDIPADIEDIPHMSKDVPIEAEDISRPSKDIPDCHITKPMNQIERADETIDRVSQACSQLTAELERNFPFEANHGFYDEETMANVIAVNVRLVQKVFCQELVDEDANERCRLENHLEIKLLRISDNFRKLNEAFKAGMEAFVNDLEASVKDEEFLHYGQCEHVLRSAEEKCLRLLDTKLSDIPASKERVEKEKLIFQSKIKRFKESWVKKNCEKRNLATSEAETLVKKCVAQYQAKVNASMGNLKCTSDLIAYHEMEKDAAVTDFKLNCKTKNMNLVTASVQNIEEMVNVMLVGIAERFIVMKEADEIVLMAAQYDAKSYYQENMDRMFDNNADGYFKDSELETLDREIQAKAMKKFIAERKPTKQQQSRVQESLQTLFEKYKQKNEVIKRSYSDKDVAIGIDLGTTYCCVAAFHMGRVEIIRNSVGTHTTPSYVTLNADGTKVVGHAAKEQAFKNPKSTIFDAKKMIGRRMDDEKLQNDMKFWPFEVNNVEGKANIKVHGKQYRPEEISAILLKHLKEEATDILGVNVTKAVITVPAYFNDGQRQATIDAAELAGLEVLGILNEPIAAALAYRLDWKVEAKPKNILVYDLGGGTFDVAIVKINDGKLEVLPVDGDSHLGGEDFDKNLALHCAQQFIMYTGIDLLKAKDSYERIEREYARTGLKRLQLYCENAKKVLSTALSYTISVDEIIIGHDLCVNVRRHQFENMNDALFRKTLSIVDDIIKSAKLRKKVIDDVLLVGGSTRIPKIKTMVQTHFNGKPVHKDINPDEAVAYGAALHAAPLNANNS